MKFAPGNQVVYYPDKGYALSAVVLQTGNRYVKISRTDIRVKKPGWVNPKNLDIQESV